MPVTPGSATKLNPVIGLSTTLTLTPIDIGDTVKMSKVLPKGVLVSFPNGNIALTDGITALNALTPIVDQVLTETEKLALMHTFSGTDETYKAVEGGFLVLGANGEIASANLPSSIWNEGTGKLLVSALPDSVRAGISVVSDYAALLAATDEQKRGLILVADASGDSTVDNGAALYQWLTDKSSFLKISEVESLDIDLSALRPNYENIQAAGAVMYDHTLMLEPPSLTDMVALMEASLNNPGQPLETASYMEMLGSGGNFVFRIENESQVVAYWNTNGGANATFINAGKPAFKLILGPSADGMHYFYATGQGSATGDIITWTEVDMGGSDVTVPTATLEKLGIVKPDGSTITINNGVLSSQGGAIATTTRPGLVQPDGASIVVDAKGIVSAAGALLSRVVYETQVTSYTGTTIIPFDNTIPQNTEGDQYMAVAITPKSSASKLLVDVNFVCSCSAPAHVILALFKNSEVNAIAASFAYFSAGTATLVINLRHVIASPGAGVATTLKLRVGPHVSATINMNCSSGGAYGLGGVLASSMIVSEFL